MGIKDIVDKPFGPYRDVIVLSDECKSLRGDFLHLSSVYMQCDHTAIGLDESEFLRTPTTPRTRNCPVLFFGVLKVKNLDWLSKEGYELLESDLQERDITQHVQHKAEPVSGLTLSNIYAKGFRINVCIGAEKTLSVLYRMSKARPFSLIIPSKDQNRQYEITSLDVETFALSRNYLTRYELLTVMEDIVATDPDKPPVQKLTIRYFINRYLAEFVFTGRDRHHRYIYHSDDSDVDSDGNTSKPRHPRHVSRAEITSIFAAQAEWILADQLIKKPAKRIVNIKKWEAFCRKVIVGRQIAKKQGPRRWGILYGQDSDEDTMKTDEDTMEIDEDIESLDLTRFGIEHQEFQRMMANATKKLKQPIRQLSPEIPAPVEWRRPQHRYDSDFSEVSTPDATDSDEGPPLDPELIEQLSPHFFHRPAPPETGYMWHCPLHHCPYILNLQNLSDTDVSGLGGPLKRYLQKKTWESLTEDYVLRGFYRMVSKHYQNHMEENGIVIHNVGTKDCHATWANPRRHRPWPPRDVEVAQAPVKQEVEDIVIRPPAGPSARTRPHSSWS